METSVSRESTDLSRTILLDPLVR